MSSIRKVAIAGAAGSVGEFIIPELLKYFEVTALIRLGSTSKAPSSVASVTVDYNDTAALTKALQGFDALISTVGSPGISQQRHLIDAAVAAKVKRFIPSEFGCDLSNARAATLPVFKPKVEIDEYMREKLSGSETTYTSIYNNAFLDWGIDRTLLIDIKGKKMELYDGGEKSWTATPLDFVAKGVVSVLQNPDKTANRAIRLHGASVTQKQLLEYAQKATGSEGWEVKNERTSEDIERLGYENLKTDPNNVYGWVIPFLGRAIYGEGLGGDFSKDNDNELLGLKALSDKGVEKVVKSCA